MTQETFEKMVERIAEEADDMADAKIQMPGEYHPDWHNVRDLIFAARLRDELAKGQMPVGYQELFDAISAAVSNPYPGAISVSVKSFTDSIGPLYTRPFVSANEHKPLQPAGPEDQAIYDSIADNYFAPILFERNNQSD